jgi:hypothetical protein
MLSAAMLREEVDVILDLIATSKIDEARQRMELLRPQVASDYGRGAMLALGGIVTSLTKSKGGELLDREKTRRSIERIMNVQMLDDVDRGYFQTITKWMKRVKPQQQRQPESGSAPPA